MSFWLFCSIQDRLQPRLLQVRLLLTGLWKSSGESNYWFNYLGQMNHWSTMKLFWWMRSLKKTAVNSGKPSPYDDYFHPVSFLVLSPSFEIWWQFYSVYTSGWLGYGSETLTHVDGFMVGPPWTWPRLVRSWSNEGQEICLNLTNFSHQSFFWIFRHEIEIDNSIFSKIRKIIFAIESRLLVDSAFSGKLHNWNSSATFTSVQALK